MPAVQVDVAPVIIDWVIQSTSNANIDTEVINKLSKWKSGEKKPTFNQVNSISRATRIPLGYFFLTVPPVENLAVLQYRTIDSVYAGNPSRDLVDTIHDMERVQEWMRDHLIDSGHDKLEFVGSCKHQKSTGTVVNTIRETLNIEPDWYRKIKEKTEAFKFFRSKLEDVGTLVMMSGIVGNNTRRSLNIEEFRAFTLSDDFAPLIFINANDSHGAKLFSLLHEAAHIWLGASNLYNDRYGNAYGANEVEVLCNAVAAEILVPSDFFKAEWARKSDQKLNKRIQILASQFNCGAVVIARKALDSNYINREEYKEIVDEAIRHFHTYRKKGTGGNYYATAASRIDNRFIVALDGSVKEGKTQFTEAYRLTNTNRKTFSNLVDEVSGVA